MSRPRSYEVRFLLPATIERCFALFCDPSRLNSLTPDWFDLRPLEPAPKALSAGTEIAYRLRWRGLPMRWTSRIVEWEPPQHLTYEQALGPYRSFRHEHRFHPVSGGTEILDRVIYRPYGGSVTDRLFVRSDLETIFRHRAERSRELLAGSTGTTEALGAS